jgi:hypothetical protein
LCHACKQTPFSPADDEKLVLKKAEIAQRLPVTNWTIDRWLKEAIFANPSL